MAPLRASPLFPSFFPDGRLSLPPSPLATFYNYAAGKSSSRPAGPGEASGTSVPHGSSSLVLSPSHAFPAFPSDPSSVPKKKKRTSRSSGVVRLTSKQRQDLEDVEKGTLRSLFSFPLPSPLLFALYFLFSPFSQ